ncbi:hypothetical protein FHS83_001623 [Rhizomicrobium palustre]|uniref:DUF2806 domain-containing protein n=1 Tax=Rhizomicrobium palustre TaxID=189966 RepID=A0A846MYL7_9PROT|nr:DUF2806 domain-containing protein [Rhizomicrobium palustre]NIK88305.1 hypothetical protein [Rhizomicrobium palustre]
MSGGNSLINFGDLSKPVTTLIEKISDAVGGIARPGQIISVAKAEAKAEIIRAEARIEISDLERRAMERMFREEAQKQENIENITAKALPLLKEDAKPDQIEKDWLTYLFDRARLFSDDEMQMLWAKILADEANTQNSFSRRTIEIVASMDKRDARLFTKFCSFCWDIPSKIPVIFSEDNRQVYADQGIHFSLLEHLDAIGLLRHSPNANFLLTEQSTTIDASYFGERVKIANPGSQPLEVGEAMFTRAGSELATICVAEKNEAYFEHVLAVWGARGFPAITGDSTIP